MILDEIVESNRADLELRKREASLEEIRKLAEGQTEPKDFAAVLKGERIRLIAEVKKASPSKGLIRADFHPVEIARTYTENGAAAISVLTEEKHFQGSLKYLKDIRQALGDRRPPLLRKDFVFDPYQVYEARAYGADAVLLIVAILGREKLEELLALGHKLGLGCLVEVHSRTELETALETGAEVIGINNRDLTTFEVSLETTKQLKPLIPAGKTVVSESGIKTREDIKMLEGLGIDAVLIGESLMASEDIAGKMRELYG